MRIKRGRILGRKKWASPKGVTGFSDRSGMPYRYSQMKLEQGTGRWIHKSEDDGKWNLTEAYKDPLVPAEPQKLQNGRDVPSGAVSTVLSLYLEISGTTTADKLHTDNLEQNALEIS
jgi:hypothetical protein